MRTSDTVRTHLFIWKCQTGRKFRNFVSCLEPFGGRSEEEATFNAAKETNRRFAARITRTLLPAIIVIFISNQTKPNHRRLSGSHWRSSTAGDAERGRDDQEKARDLRASEGLLRQFFVASLCRRKTGFFFYFCPATSWPACVLFCLLVTKLRLRQHHRHPGNRVLFHHHHHRHPGQVCIFRLCPVRQLWHLASHI